MDILFIEFNLWIYFLLNLFMDVLLLNLFMDVVLIKLINPNVLILILKMKYIKMNNSYYNPFH